MRDQPLESELIGRGGKFARPVQTSPEYRLFAMSSYPPKPALVHVGSGGSAIAVELCQLLTDALGAITASVLPPLGIGPVVLADCSAHPGFVAQAGRLGNSLEITRFGGWRRYLSQGDPEHDGS
jgi:allophanate hydrolase